MRPCLLLLALVLATAPAAQVNVGAGGYAVEYALGDNAPAYTFDSDVYAAGFYSATGLFHVFYGTDVQPSAAEGDSTKASALGADLASAGRLPIATLGEDVTVNLFVPLGVELGYRYFRVEPSLADGVEPDEDDIETLHLGLAALRVGGGAEAEVPLEGLPLASALTGSASLTLGAGARADFDPLEASNQLGGAEGDGVDAYGLRTSTLTLQAKLDGVLGTDLGAILGYTLRTTRTDSTPLESVGDLVGVVTEASDYTQLDRLHLVRVGVLF
ncbi:hypothetical protein [Rubrivirga marina]|uniref:Outer membrane protein beta-barrel domain-containing protein n=1 Tax=Rubrivirga marina TaxID=1196024 RepID=A0A271IWH5_9BACT|nr:hypothetical protein [Rubrivirga marina]PAP75480.1 hypothetical protein BSZ37_02970 [Rubrivirga marina]